MSASVKARIDELFDDYLARRGVKKKIAALVAELDGTHVDLLLDKVAGIGDPMDYANAAETSAPVLQFFAFVDLVSALILLLGPEAIDRATARDAGRSEYLRWVQKYVSDDRFHAQVMEQLPASLIRG